MYKAYKFTIKPNTEQEIALAKGFGCCRWFWNYSLNLCQETYKTTGKGLTRNYIQGLLPSLKKEYEWLTDAYSQCLQVVALNLSQAYQNFFEKRARLPRFKSKHGRQSISYPANVKFEGDYLKLPGKVGLVYCVRHREFEGTIKTVTISKTPDGKYYASILVDDELELPETSKDGKGIGIDKVAKVHSKISRCREDFLHKLSRKIVNENQVIAVENLNVKGMVRNHNLAKAISDCGWGMFCTMLKYKAEWEGKTYIEVDRFFPSSKTCNVCLNQVASLPLDVRTWTCEHCKTTHDRDINAAINIKNEALRILVLSKAEVLSLGTSDTAYRGDVRPKVGRKSVLRQSPVK